MFLEDARIVVSSTEMTR